MARSRRPWRAVPKVGFGTWGPLMGPGRLEARSPAGDCRPAGGKGVHACPRMLAPEGLVRESGGSCRHRWRSGRPTGWPPAPWARKSLFVSGHPDKVPDATTKAAGTAWAVCARPGCHVPDQGHVGTCLHGWLGRTGGPSAVVIHTWVYAGDPQGIAGPVGRPGPSPVSWATKPWAAGRNMVPGPSDARGPEGQGEPHRVTCETRKDHWLRLRRSTGTPRGRVSSPA